jgi:hypothetical protein
LPKSTEKYGSSRHNLRKFLHFFAPSRREFFDHAVEFEESNEEVIHHFFIFWLFALFVHTLLFLSSTFLLLLQLISMDIFFFTIEILGVGCEMIKLPPFFFF